MNRELPLGLDLLDRLLEHDGQGIGLLSGRAAGHPHPQGMAGRLEGQERGEVLFEQLLPHAGIAKEARHPDQQLLEEQIHLLRVLLQVADISHHPADLVDAHAALDPTIERVPLVEGKVVTDAGAQQNNHFFEGALRLVSQRHLSPGGEQGAIEEGIDLLGQFLHRRHDIRQPGLNRTARHAVEFRRRRILHQRHARHLLDGAQPQRAIRAHAGKNHADAVLLPVLRQGAEKQIDGQAQPARRRRLEQVQNPVQDGHVPVRRNHIDAVRLDPRAILDLEYLHSGGAMEQLRQDALVRRVQMLDDDKRHAAARRHVS